MDHEDSYTDRNDKGEDNAHVHTGRTDNERRGLRYRRGRRNRRFMYTREDI